MAEESGKVKADSPRSMPWLAELQEPVVGEKEGMGERPQEQEKPIWNCIITEL